MLVESQRRHDEGPNYLPCIEYLGWPKGCYGRVCCSKEDAFLLQPRDRSDHFLLRSLHARCDFRDKYDIAEHLPCTTVKSAPTASVLNRAKKVCRTRNQSAGLLHTRFGTKPEDPRGWRICTRTVKQKPKLKGGTKHVLVQIAGYTEDIDVCSLRHIRGRVVQGSQTSGPGNNSPLGSGDKGLTESVRDGCAATSGHGGQSPWLGNLRLESVVIVQRRDFWHDPVRRFHRFHGGKVTGHDQSVSGEGSI